VKAALSVPTAGAGVKFHLRSHFARQKLRTLIGELNVSVREISAGTVTAAMDWMAVYAEQEPDFADAVMVVLTTEIKASRVWTYDREFRRTWRKPDGSAIPLALRSRNAPKPSHPAPGSAVGPAWPRDNPRSQRAAVVDDGPRRGEHQTA